MAALLESAPSGFDSTLVEKAIGITEKFLDPIWPVEYRVATAPSVDTYESVARLFEYVPGSPQDKAFILSIIRDGADRGAAQSIPAIYNRLKWLLLRQ